MPFRSLLRLVFLALFALFIYFGCVSFVCAQFLNVRVNNESFGDPEEVSIALNPLNPNQLAVGANLQYLFTSSNGGLDWTGSIVSSQYGEYGDPCLMFDDSGVLYYEHLSYQNSPSEFLYRIVVQRSTDAGISFDSGEQIGYNPPANQDKAWLGLDRSPTASNGTILTSWTQFDAYGSNLSSDSSHIFFSRSTDRGRTWSEHVRVDDTGGDCRDSRNTVEGAVAVAGPLGQIYIVWSGHQKIYFNQSLDGGQTFGGSRIIADQPGGWDLGVPGIFRANGLPMIVSDLNPASPYYGRLYVMWSDRRRGVIDVYSMYSADNGLHWSDPSRVNTDSALADHFFPSMALDPVTGHVFIVFYDRRAYLDDETDVYLARSIDGGVSFDNTCISESAFTPVNTVFFGDYIHIVAFNRHVFPVWMRLDEGALSVWSALVLDTSATSSVSSIPQQDEKLWITHDGGTQPGIAFTLPSHAHVRIEVYDLLGRPVESMLDGEFGAGEYRLSASTAIPSGTYIVKMTAVPEDGTRELFLRVAMLTIAR